METKLLTVGCHLLKPGWGSRFCCPTFPWAVLYPEGTRAWMRTLKGLGGGKPEHKSQPNNARADKPSGTCWTSSCLEVARGRYCPSTGSLVASQFWVLFCVHHTQIYKAHLAQPEIAPFTNRSRGNLKISTFRFRRPEKGE